MTTYEYMEDMFENYFGAKLNDNCKRLIDKWLSQYSSDEIENAIYIACENYEDCITAFQKIGGILYNRSKIKNMYFEDCEE